MRTTTTSTRTIGSRTGHATTIRTSTIRTSTIRRTAVLAGTITLVTAACGGGESAQEAALERLIESESGQDIDLDLDGDGGFSVQTEDGEFSIDLHEDGGFTFDSDQGSGSFSVGGDGGGDFSFEGQDGQDGEDGSIQIDSEENGGFTVSDDNGETVVGEVGDDGGFTITGEDGESTFESGVGIPEQWPNDIPRPEGLTDVNGTFVAEGGQTNIVASGTPSGDGETALADFVAALVDAGFTETSSFSQEGAGASVTLDRDGVTVSASLTDFGDMSQMVVSVSSF